MPDRILFVKPNCRHCRKYIGVVEKINMLLPIGKQIERISIDGFDPRIQKYVQFLQKYGTPFLVIDGYAVSGMTTEEFSEGFLKGYLKGAGDLWN